MFGLVMAAAVTLVAIGGAMKECPAKVYTAPGADGKPVLVSVPLCPTVYRSGGEPQLGGDGPGAAGDSGATSGGNACGGTE